MGCAQLASVEDVLAGVRRVYAPKNSVQFPTNWDLYPKKIESLARIRTVPVATCVCGVTFRYAASALRVLQHENGGR